MYQLSLYKYLVEVSWTKDDVIQALWTKLTLGQRGGRFFVAKVFKRLKASGMEWSLQENNR